MLEDIISNQFVAATVCDVLQQNGGLSIRKITYFMRSVPRKEEQNTEQDILIEK